MIYTTRQRHETRHMTVHPRPVAHLSRHDSVRERVTGHDEHRHTVIAELAWFTAMIICCPLPVRHGDRAAGGSDGNRFWKRLRIAAKSMKNATHLSG